MAPAALERTVEAALVGALAALLIGGNYFIIIRFYWTGRRESLIPVLGGVVGAIAVLLAPIPRAWMFAIVPPLVDPGCLPGIAGSLIFAYRHRRSGPVSEDTEHDHDRTR